MRARSWSWMGVALLAVTMAGCGLVGLITVPAALPVTVVASGLDIAWAMAFTPDGRLFITERPGRLRVVINDVLQAAPVMTIAVSNAGEGGLLGLAADPSFATNGYLYAFVTAPGPVNRIVRLVVTGNTASQDAVLLDGIPASTARHNGGRLKVGPDGMLYATTGDANNTAFSQNAASLAGKILRLTRTGAVPPDNPTPGSYVYTLGHRNAQGLAWDALNTLYATEHGESSNDEVNRIQPGRNYGWPIIQGRGNNPAYVDPVYLFFPDTCAPSGATFVTSGLLSQWNGDLLFTCLRGVHLHRLRFAGPGSDQVIAHERLYANAYGRLRDAIVGPDGAVYVTTSNGGGADRLLRIGR